MRRITSQIQLYMADTISLQLKSPVDGLVRSGDDNLDMVKRYVLLPTGKRDQSGIVRRGFMLGLADIGCFGTRLYDPAGYPHDSEWDALLSDWQALNGDMWDSINHGPEEKKTTSSGEEAEDG